MRFRAYRIQSFFFPSIDATAGINVTTPLVRDFTTLIVTADQRENPRRKLERTSVQCCSVHARSLYSQLNSRMLDRKERFRWVAC